MAGSYGIIFNVGGDTGLRLILKTGRKIKEMTGKVLHDGMVRIIGMKQVTASENAIIICRL